MSEDPVEAINQVVDCIDEGCRFGNGHVCGGWLRRASKDEILDWVFGNLRGRAINALKRTEEKIDSLMKENERAIKLFESLSEFVAWYEEKTDDLDVIAERAIEVLDKSTSVGCEIIEDYARLKCSIETKRNCDRFNSGDPEKDADDALHAYLDEGVAGFKGVASYLLSPIKEKPCTHATDATI